MVRHDKEIRGAVCGYECPSYLFMSIFKQIGTRDDRDIPGVCRGTWSNEQLG